MRAYYWGNMYLSSIQQGIQALHCTSEMFLKYLPHTERAGPLYDWAKNHKTSILLNGGDQAALLDIWVHLNQDENMYPLAYIQTGCFSTHFQAKTRHPFSL